MGKERNNSGLIVLVVVLFLLVLGLGGYIIYDKVLSNKITTEKTNNGNSNDKSTNIDNDKTSYKMGDLVKLSKFSNNNTDSNDDYTQWYVLEEQDGYIRLYSNNIWSGKSTLNEIGQATVDVYNRFKELGYNVITVRQLNEEELKLFSCSIDYDKISDTIESHDKNPLTNVAFAHIDLQNDEVNCANLPSFINAYSDIQLFGYSLSLGEHMSLDIHNSAALVGFLHPVVVLPTNEIG